MKLHLKAWVGLCVALAIAFTSAGAMAAGGPGVYYFWDINGTAAGAGAGGVASGEWGTTTATTYNWNNNAEGTGTLSAFPNYSEAVFSAGTDATGSSIVTVNVGAVNCNSLTLQEGNITLTTTAGKTISFRSSSTGSDSNTGKITVAAGSTLRFEIGVASASTAFIKLGAGTLEQAVSTSYAKQVYVTEGTLALLNTGAFNSAAGITINGGTFINNSTTNCNRTITFTSGTIGGSGTFSSGFTIGANNTLAAGNGIGTTNMFNATATFASGGTYAWQLADNSLAAGTGWDLLGITNSTGSGTLAVTATADDKFNIVLQTLNGSTQGESLNWDPQQNHSWLIVSSPSAITGWDVADGAASSLFAINAANFVGADAKATWYVSKTDNNVYLNYAVPEPATMAMLILGGAAALARRRSR